MYIIAKLDGTLIQKSNEEVTDSELQAIKNRFETELNTQVIATKDETILNNSEKFDYFSVEIVEGSIVDVVCKEKPNESISLTIEERLTIAEDTINYLLGL